MNKEKVKSILDGLLKGFGLLFAAIIAKKLGLDSGHSLIMIVGSQTFLNTGTQQANFEDLVNMIYRVSNEDAPFLNKIGTTKAKAINHEWPTQAVRAGAANAAAEGFTPSFAVGNITTRVRNGNQCQILKQEFSVSLTQEEVDKAGLGQASEYDFQKQLKFVEIYKDADLALLQGTKVTRAADAGTAGQMDGALAWVPSANAKDAGQSVLTQDLFNDLTRLIWKLSGQTADLIVVNGFQRRQISGWTVNFKRHDSKDADLVDTVETYRGDWGTQVVLPDLQMDETQLLACKSDFLKKAYLRPAFHYELGQTVDARRGYVGTELTLEAANPNSLGRIFNLAFAAQ